jgi:hypothetical protein
VLRDAVARHVMDDHAFIQPAWQSYQPIIGQKSVFVGLRPLCSNAGPEQSPEQIRWLEG